MKTLIENRWFILTSLVLMVLGLLFNRGVSTNYISFEEIVKNKDKVELFIKVFEFILLIIAGIFTYLKFFRGHLFLSKAELMSNATSIKIDSTYTLHYLNIRIKNTGNFTMNDPIIKVKSHFYPESPEIKEVVISKKRKQKRKVIRPNSIMSVPYKLKVKNEVKAIEFLITVELENRKWSQSILSKVGNE